MDKKQTEILKNFIYNYRIDDVQRTTDINRYHGDPYPVGYNMNAKTAMDYYSYKTTMVPQFTLKIDQDKLLSIVNKVNEMDELMQDPETKRLLMEAKFIYRMKRGIF